MYQQLVPMNQDYLSVIISNFCTILHLKKWGILLQFLSRTSTRWINVQLLKQNARKHFIWINFSSKVGSVLFYASARRVSTFNHMSAVLGPFHLAATWPSPHCRFEICSNTLPRCWSETCNVALHAKFQLI